MPSIVLMSLSRLLARLLAEWARPAKPRDDLAPLPASARVQCAARDKHAANQKQQR